MGRRRGEKRRATSNSVTTLWKTRLAQSNNSVLTASYDKLDDDEKTFNLQ